MMKKSKIGITIGLMIVSLFASSAFAQAKGATITATLPAHTVTINGQVLDSAYAPYPLLVYKDITYLPLTTLSKNKPA